MEYIGIQKKNGGVVEALQQAILSGQIPAGTEMTQNELAESLGVSRMPVREALMILEYQGLIIRLPNNRIKAADLTEETLRQILALGAQLERQAMRALPQDAMLAGGGMLPHQRGVGGGGRDAAAPYPADRPALSAAPQAAGEHPGDLHCLCRERTSYAGERPACPPADAGPSGLP